jgi:hypothetical protein
MVDASVAGVYVRREDGAAGKDRRFIDRFVSGSLIIGREASAPPLTTSQLDFGLVDKRTCFLLRSIGFFDHIQIDMRTVPTSPSRLALRSFCMPRTAQKKVLAYLGSPRFVGKNGPLIEHYLLPQPHPFRPRHVAKSGSLGASGSDPQGDSTSDSLFRDGNFGYRRGRSTKDAMCKVWKGEGGIG